MIPADWTPHRRDDGELVGWVRPVAEDWVGVDLLGRDVGPPVDWLDAESALEERGLAWLADAWMLERDAAGPLRVRIVEVVPGGAEPGRVVVKTDDFGAIDAPSESVVLPWPAPSALRPLRPGDGAGTPWG
jgi:hypothetical protein